MICPRMHFYCISDQWPVISDRLENRHAESRKSETYIHGGAGNSGMWVLYIN